MDPQSTTLLEEEKSRRRIDNKKYQLGEGIVIKYFVLKGLTPTQIKEEMHFTLGGSAPSFSTIKKWAADFKRGSLSTFDDERSDRPKTSTIVWRPLKKSTMS